MSLSNPMLSLCKRRNLNETPAAVKKYVQTLIEQGFNMKDIALLCDISTKTLRLWRRDLQI